MKRLIVMLFFIGTVSSLSGQSKASKYLYSLPFPPSGICENDTTSIHNFMRRLAAVNKELSADIKGREKEVNDYMKAHKQEAKETMIKNSGLTLTPEQMQKMKQDNKHMTQEQKMKMADEMMKQNANISMEEVQKMKAQKKDTAAIKRWSQAYATENMADQSADQAAIEAKQLKMKSLADITREMSDINEKLQKTGSRFTLQFDSLQILGDTTWADLQKRTRPIKEEIDKILEQWAQTENKTEDEGQAVDRAVKQLQEQIYDLEFAYCPSLTDKYVKITNEYRTYLPTVFDDYDRVDELNREITYRQTGVQIPASSEGMSALKSVENLVSLLSHVEKYRIRGQKYEEKETIGM